MKYPGHCLTFYLLSVISSHGQACSVKPIQAPPKWIDDQWQTVKTEPESFNQPKPLSDITQYDYVFTATYHQETNNPEQQSAYLETDSVWRGNVPPLIGLNRQNLRLSDSCDDQRLSYGHRYVFFGRFGNRTNPILITTFRPHKDAWIEPMRQPRKRWVRGRLIILKD